MLGARATRRKRRALVTKGVGEGRCGRHSFEGWGKLPEGHDEMWGYVAMHEERCERAKGPLLALDLAHTLTAGCGDNSGAPKEPRAYLGRTAPDRTGLTTGHEH